MTDEIKSKQRFAVLLKRITNLEYALEAIRLSAEPYNKEVVDAIAWIKPSYAKINQATEIIGRLETKIKWLEHYQKSCVYHFKQIENRLKALEDLLIYDEQEPEDDDD